MSEILQPGCKILWKVLTEQWRLLQQHINAHHFRIRCSAITYGCDDDVCPHTFGHALQSLIQKMIQKWKKFSSEHLGLSQFLTVCSHHLTAQTSNNYTERNFSQNRHTGQFLRPQYQEIDQNALQPQDIEATNVAFLKWKKKLPLSCSHHAFIQSTYTHVGCNRFIILPWELPEGILGSVGNHKLKMHSISD